MYEKNNNERGIWVKQILQYVENEEKGGDSKIVELLKKGGTVYKFVEGEHAKTNQLRKFYDELISIKGDKLDPYRLMRIELNSAYAHGRNYISKEMDDFISGSVELVLREQNYQKDRFERFKRVFEAMVAYYPLFSKEKGD